MKANKKLMLAMDVLKDAAESGVRLELSRSTHCYRDQKDSPTSIKRRLTYVRQLCLDACRELDKEG